jgi:thiamine monophosphate synthase
VMLMLVTRDDARLPSIVRAAVEGGVNVVQVRGEVDVDAVCAAVGDRARVVVNSCHPERERGAWVGGRRADRATHAPRPLAHARGDIGLHLPENARFESSSFTGRSVHSVDAALRAEFEGCDYVVAGSVFPTSSHPGGSVGGVQLVRDIAAAVRIPVVAIGGITASNARQCIDAGARGVAVISAIFDAGDPRRAAQDLWKAIA